MMKAVIIDDERPAINVLRMFLERTCKVEVIASFQSAAKALNEMEKLKPDVVFLDIEMPEMTGIELASNIVLTEQDIEIVFVTAYNQYALEAFKVNAVDYLLKPVLEKDINKTVNRLMKILGKDLHIGQDNKVEARIQCFGGFEVYSDSNNQPLKWRTSKSKELLAYFFQNRGIPINKWKLCEVLWPEGDQNKIDINLHTTIYKMKKTLRSSNIDIDIKFINKAYVMNMNGIYSDVEEFEALIDENFIVKDDNVDKYKKAFSIYRNNYLEENDYIWSLDLKEVYLQKFIKLSQALVDFYIERQHYDKAITIMKRVLEMSPLEEHLHETLLNLYIMTDDRISFVKHYNFVKELFNAELGIELSDKLKIMYKMINLA